jgi:hypothetical protein
MSFKTKLFVILWLAGMAGVLSFLFVDLSKMLANLPVPAGQELPSSMWVLKLLSLIQPTILLSLAVFVGVALASKVGLSAPVAEAAAAHRQLSLVFKPQLVPGLIGGITGGAAILLIWSLCKPFLPPEFVTRSLALSNLLPLPTRLLYGGFTEELLLRWGVMTFLVWSMAAAPERTGQATGPLCCERDHNFGRRVWFGSSTNSVRVSFKSYRLISFLHYFCKHGVRSDCRLSLLEERS